jgi:hypothetical protein
MPPSQDPEPMNPREMALSEAVEAYELFLLTQGPDSRKVQRLRRVL